MNKVISALSVLVAAVVVFAFGYFAGRVAKSVVISKMETTSDTLWREVHDTCFMERAVEVVRTDTVRLAYVPQTAISGTYQDGYGYENGISWTDVVCAENAPTTHDTLYVHDSVLVEVPITQRVFIGDNYVITAEGFRVRLTDVSITYPTVTNTISKSFVKPKHWGIGLGAQVGYGYTTKGFAPYAGLGVSFGYIF